MPRLKVCGICDETFAVEAAGRGVDYLGFIFAGSSPRRVVPSKAAEIANAVISAGIREGTSPRPRFVGVFTDTPANAILEISGRVPLDVVQLHAPYSDEDVKRLAAAGLEVWRLYDQANGRGVEDAVLLDGRDGSRCGGTGRLADWALVAELKSAGYKVVLAGGIGADNISGAIKTRADVIDVNSSLETAPGVKSIRLLDDLLATVRAWKNT